MNGNMMVTYVNIQLRMIMSQLRVIMKALLLVPFKTIYAQCCGDKLLRWKEKPSSSAAANNSLVENV